jgi:deazaflavin-dependent oxidoreductase (nitroreductase family)
MDALIDPPATVLPPEPLAPPPLERPLATIVPAVDRGLKGLNRWFMVPALRLGLGPWLGTPFGGYILLLRVRGRKSGRWRETPLSYLVTEGSAWVMAGFGPRTEWYRNLVADPAVEAWLPGRTMRCRARVEADPAVRARVAPALTRATGVPGIMVGCNPWTSPDERILEALAGIPLVRLEPEAGPIAAGPDDPGGRAWIWRQAAVTLATVWLLRDGCRGLRQRRG